MESSSSLKKTETVLTFGNTLALLGVTVYFHRSLTSMQAQMAKMSDLLGATIKEVGSLKNGSSKLDQIVGEIRRINNDIVNIDRELSETPTADELERCFHDVESLAEAVKGQGLEIDIDNVLSSHTQPTYHHQASGRGYAPQRVYQHHKTQAGNKWGTSVGGGIQRGRTQQSSARSPPREEHRRTTERARRGGNSVRFSDEVDEEETTNPDDLDEAVKQVRSIQGDREQRRRRPGS